ncbi:hypothetical protein [Ravibacter arvi]|uniref:hypothetical protein n=1 Tax=Ravibacter arvi TaxID=2051041 RepID=UPI0031EF38B4
MGVQRSAFDRLRHRPSTGSGTGLRQTQAPSGCGAVRMVPSGWRLSSSKAAYRMAGELVEGCLPEAAIRTAGEPVEPL